MEELKRILRNAYITSTERVVIKVRKFSNKNVDYKFPERISTSCVNDDSLSNVTRSCYYIFYVYPNGRDSSTKGYVSLEVHCDPLETSWHSSKTRIGHTEVIGLVAVVDAEGNRRFPQSFAFTHDLVETDETQGTRWSRQTFLFDKYISRDFLLTAADDLIPENTLTIQVDLVLNEYHPEEAWFTLELEFQHFLPASFSQTHQRRLLLQSPVAELLRRESRCFERLFHTPMAEKESGYVEIPEREYETFLSMVKVLCYLEVEGSILKFDFQSIFEVYATAHFYGIERVLDTCRCWLRLLCRWSELTSEISRLADFYDDPFLKKVVSGDFRGSKDETKFPGCDLRESYTHEPVEEWSYTLLDHGASPLAGQNRFIFERRSKMGEKVLRSGHVNENVMDISNCYI